MDKFEASEKKIPDSFGSEAHGSEEERLGSAAAWSFGEPFWRALEILRGNQVFFLTAALLAGVVALLPLGAMVAGLFLGFLASVVAMECFTSPHPLHFSSLMNRWSDRFPAMLGTYGLFFLVFVGTCFVWGMASMGVLLGTSLLLKLGGPLGMASGGMGLVVLLGLLLLFFCFLLLTPGSFLLLNYAFSETILFRASPVKVWKRAFRLVRASGLPLLGFFMVMFVAGLCSVTPLTLLLASSQSAVSLSGFSPVTLVVKILGSTVNYLVQMTLGMVWTFRFLHDRARVGQMTSASSAAPAAPQEVTPQL
jgi:hypothetical protein